MMKYYGLDWMGTILGLASIYYLGRHNKAGFILRICASVFWIAFGIVAETPAGVVANLAAILLCFRGLDEWKSSRSVVPVEEDSD
jgi:hypothetical protein